MVPVPVAVMVKFAFPPLQMVVVPPNTALSALRPPLLLDCRFYHHYLVQVPLVKVAIVYVVLVEGLTLIVIVGAVPLKAVPSDRVPDMVPEPDTPKDKVAELPLQSVAVPLSIPLGVDLPSISSAPKSGAEPVPMYPGISCLVLPVVIHCNSADIYATTFNPGTFCGINMQKIR